MCSLPAALPPRTRSPTSGLGDSPGERLRERIAALQATIAASERKRQSIDTAIAQRRAALNRLLAADALRVASTAPRRDE